MPRQFLLGMGTGGCGLELLAEIWRQQPHCRATFQQLPLLPWKSRDQGREIQERLSRWQQNTTERFVADVAAFYLPYAEAALRNTPNLSCVCLTRPEDEVLATMTAALNAQSRVPLDHWVEEPTPLRQHDLNWSRTFPQYTEASREAGLRRYWREYNAQARELAERYPERFLFIDTQELTTEAGVRRLLNFCGFPWSDQKPLVGKPPAVPTSVASPRLAFPDPMDPRRCVVLVPFTGFIHQECDLALRELERRGYAVRRVAGYAAIDQGRNQLATDALLEGYEETLWIDSDVGFNPDDVDKLRRHNLPMTCGIYPQKGKRALACHVAPGGKTMRFGKDGGLVELLYAGTGFLHIRREVYAAVQRRLQLPMCNERFGHPMIPFFQPMIRSIEEAHWYLAEDYAFCERARQAGFQIFADTTIRLWHIGLYRYGWEDAGRDPERFAGFTLNFNDQRPTAVSSAPRTPRLQELTARYPWPESKPAVPPPPPRNWLFPSTQEMLAKCVPRDARIVIELGSFTGRSTRFLVEHASQATILAVDHWQGSDDMQGDAEVMAFLPRLYETFLAECWLFRDRIVPIRRKTLEALQEIADLEIVPDAVYVDADHSYEAVRDDVEAILRLFPQTIVVGDDWNWEGVQRAVTEVAQRHGYRIEAHGVGWRLGDRTRPLPG